MQVLGWIPLVLGLLILALGYLYEYLGYRFGGAVLTWCIMWGLAGIGLGLVVLGSTKRRFAIAGVLACGLSFALIAHWHFRISSAGDWLWAISVPDALGMVYGLVAIVLKTVRAARGRTSSEPTGRSEKP